MDNNTCLSMDEVARRLDRSIDTLRYWRKHGIGPRSFKLGRRVVYAESDLNAWINAQRAAGVGEDVAAG